MSEHLPQIVVATPDGLVTLAPEPGTDLESRNVTAVATDGEALWAVVDGQAIHRRATGGAWEEVGAIDRWRATCLLPLGNDALVGTSEAHMMRSAEGRIEMVEGFEAAEDRASWFTPWGGPPAVRSFARDPSGHIFVNVHVGGILRSDDGGRSWFQTIDIRDDVHDVHTATTGGREWTLAAAGAGGLVASSDGGRSWENHDSGLHATYCRAVRSCDGFVLLTASRGPGGGRAAIYRRPLASGDPFEKVHDGLPEWFSGNLDTGLLDTSGPHVALATESGDVFTSDNAGDEWRRIATGLGPINGLVFA